MKALAEHKIEPIDLVAVNLYPFEETSATAGAKPEEIIEQIDIGGPSMLRSAAKNFASVTVIVDPADYGRVLAALEAGDDDLDLRRSGGESFRLHRTYDAAIASGSVRALEYFRLGSRLERARCSDTGRIRGSARHSVERKKDASRR